MAKLRKEGTLLTSKAFIICYPGQFLLLLEFPGVAISRHNITLFINDIIGLQLSGLMLAYLRMMLRST